MPSKSRKQLVKQTFALIFPLFILWSISAGTIPGLAYQNLETPTTTNTFVEKNSTVTTTAITPDTNPTTDSSNLPETFTPTQRVDTPTSNPKSLPAIFESGAYASDELIVRFKRSTRVTRIEECFHSLDIDIRRQINELHAWVIRVDSRNLGDVYRHTLACSGVQYVEPNFIVQAADTFPNDPDWGLQYGLVNIRAPQGWDLTTGSVAVTIAIIDTGVDFGHIDLANKLVPGYDFVNNDADPQDDNGHGTHVAGIAAASSNNGTGVAGVSWGARIMPVKVLNSSSGGTYANTALGVIWAVDHGAQVINLSLGGTGPSSVLADAINYAHSRGVVVVAAAGNTGSNFVLYPARYPNVIAVAKTNSTDNWDGSNYGPEVDLAAPGTSIYSTIIGGYDYKSGSSMSTAYVSGLAAILRGIPGNNSPDAIETQMETMALDIEFAGWDDYTGAGLIQIDAAIQLAMQSTTNSNEPGAASTGSGNNPGQIAPTNTPIPTWTVSPTQETGTATASITTESGFVFGVPEMSTNTSISTENEVEAQRNFENRDYLMPCAGILLILLGLLLLWFYRKK